MLEDRNLVKMGIQFYICHMVKKCINATKKMKLDLDRDLQCVCRREDEKGTDCEQLSRGGRRVT